MLPWTWTSLWSVVSDILASPLISSGLSWFVGITIASYALYKILGVFAARMSGGMTDEADATYDD